MRLSLLPDPHTTIDTGQDEGFTMPADLSPVFWPQANPRCHGNPSRQIHVALSEGRIFIERLICQTKQNAYPFPCYATNASAHAPKRHSVGLSLFSTRLAFPAPMCPHESNPRAIAGNFMCHLKRFCKSWAEVKSARLPPT